MYIFLFAQVYAIEKSIANGNKVPEIQITTLIEMLMRQAVKLDAISAEGDAREQKTVQVYIYIYIYVAHSINMFFFKIIYFILQIIKFLLF